MSFDLKERERDLEVALERARTATAYGCPAAYRHIKHARALGIQTLREMSTPFSQESREHG